MPPSLFANKSVKVTAFWQQSWKLEPSCCVGSSLPLSVFLGGVFFTVNLRVTWLRRWLTNGTRGMWGLGKKHVTVNKERRRECKRIETWEEGRRSEKMSGGWEWRMAEQRKSEQWVRYKFYSNTQKNRHWDCTVTSHVQVGFYPIQQKRAAVEAILYWGKFTVFIFLTFYLLSCLTLHENKLLSYQFRLKSKGFVSN